MLRTPHLTLVALVFALDAVSPSPAFSAVIVEFNFNDNNTIVDFVAPNAMSTNYLDGGGLTNTAFSMDISALGFQGANTAANAIAAGNYWEFTVTANAGFHLDLTDLMFNEKRGTQGPMNFQIEVLGAGLQGSPGLSTTGYMPRIVDLSSFTNLSSITIRLIAFGNAAGSANGRWFNDNVRLNGSVVLNPVHSVAPEPASLALWGMGSCIGLIAVRRRAKGKKLAV